MCTIEEVMIKGLILENINWRRAPVHKNIIEMRENIKFWILIKMKIGMIFCQVMNKIFMFHVAILDILIIQE